MGTLISDKFTAWEAECNQRFNQLKANEEVFRLRFSFKNRKYDNKKPYYLVAYDDKNSVEVLRRQVVMDIAMADDFGFGF